MTINYEDLFVTRIAHGHIEVESSLKTDFLKWIEITKLIDEDCSKETTTSNGWQYAFKASDIQPSWHKTIIERLPNFGNIKSSWVVDYEAGGYQDIHIHKSSSGTLIVNLVGKGNLMLYDPRPMAVAVSEPYAVVKQLLPGDWIYIPGWLAHSSRPCPEKRSIYVVDFK